MNYYFKDLSEKKKKTINDEVLLIFVFKKDIKNPTISKYKFIKRLEKRQFKTKIKLRKWLWWNVGIKVEKIKKEV